MNKCYFDKVLLPVDGSPNALRAVKFAGALLKGIESLNITFLYVMAGGYLSEHMKNVDFRAELIKGSEVFKKIKEKYVEENIMPFMSEYEKILKDAGFNGLIEKRIEEGDPGNKIIEIAKKENFQTVILARRGMSELKGFFLGSISSKVLHGLINHNVYLVGEKVVEETPVSQVLVPVDGSEYSMKAVEHAVCVVKMVKSINKITLLRVVNLSFYLERVREGIDPEQEAKEILDKAKNKFLEEGISQDLIITKVSLGFPKEEIVKEIKEGGYDLVVMGRKGRSALREIVLGGVSSSVISRCLEPTIAIINL
ncbi:universal stress protein [Thermodesulfobacterium sp. TA1]|uniref:universal stress protein n=1 Tax=Thermodesulfobacterium sp. TA1 TaxID=2234087 RepID=UPI0012326AE8|nr:universal stress protein [Thermodesulfobacterium sp. TA1]QER42621.1 universal stress protein [Thermodesulfobacterium sp. TA1]